MMHIAALVGALAHASDTVPPSHFVIISLITVIALVVTSSPR